MDKDEISKEVFNKMKTYDSEFNKVLNEHKSFDIGYKYINPVFTKKKHKPGYIDEKIILYLSADLHTEKYKNSDILDIGTGTGYFPFICNTLGHTSSGLDIGGQPIFDKVCEILNVNVTIFKIEKFKPFVNTGLKYDLITAHRTCFNCHKEEGLWDVEEWMYFINDIFTNHLKNNGRLYINFNKEKKGDTFGKRILYKLFEGFFNNSTSIMITDLNKIKDNYEKIH